MLSDIIFLKNEIYKRVHDVQNCDVKIIFDLYYYV